MFSTKEVATILCCTKRNVTAMVSTGKLKPIYKNKAFFLFDEAEVLTVKTLRDARRK